MLDLKLIQISSYWPRRIKISKEAEWRKKPKDFLRVNSNTKNILMIFLSFGKLYQTLEQKCLLVKHTFPLYFVGCMWLSSFCDVYCENSLWFGHLLKSFSINIDKIYINELNNEFKDLVVMENSSASCLYSHLIIVRHLFGQLKCIIMSRSIIFTNSIAVRFCLFSIHLILLIHKINFKDGIKRLPFLLFSRGFLNE